MRTFLFRLIGILEIAGGFDGAATMLRRLLPLGSTSNSLFALLGMALFLFVLIAGVMLVAGNERGVSLSRWAQLLQLPLVATPMFSYALHSGAYLNIYASVQAAPRLGMDWHLGTQGVLLALAGPSVSRLGINLLALVAWLGLRIR